jgi:hypothetical protein
MVTMAITLVIMGGTMAALSNAWKATDSTNVITGVNANLRMAMDLVVRDLLQVGQGLPVGRNITIPSGGTAVRLPGPPGTNYTLPTTTLEFSAVMPGPGRGPVINGVATDMITTFAADSSFEGRALNALTDNSMTVALNRPRNPLVGNPAIQDAITNGANITDTATPEDNIDIGDLIMLTRGALSAIVEVTGVNGQTIEFNSGDALNLNQTAATDGTVREYRDLDTTAAVSNETVGAVSGKIPSEATRIRMITYYIDAVTDPTRPRLIRRMNNRTCSPGSPGCSAMAFDNTRGTAVAFDLEGLTFGYDLADSAGHITDLRMTAADIAGGAGAAAGCPCDPERIRKINASLSGRGRRAMKTTGQVYRNSLFTQISLRSLAFVDRYE